MEAIDKLRELSKKLEDPYFIKEFEEGFEKFLKERDMKIYHVKTQADYDALMIKLEEKGRKWICGNEPTFFKFWKTFKESTCIIISDKGVTFGDIEYYKKQYPNTPIIEYKAKVANKMEKKCEKCDVEYHNNAKYCSMCGNRLVAEPEFKYGDIVASRIFRDASFSLVRLNEDLTKRITLVDGFWYTKDDCAIGDMSLEVFKEDTRIATPEEITEYKVALNFHNHGREPFEVKEGDLIKSKSGRNIIVFYPENYSRVSFLKDGWKLLKTSEEVNEWIKGE